MENDYFRVRGYVVYVVEDLFTWISRSFPGTEHNHQSTLFRNSACSNFTTCKLPLFSWSKDIDLERIGLIDTDSASLDVIATSASVHNSTTSDGDIVAVQRS